MTEPDEQLPTEGTAEPAARHDPEVAEEYAESVSIDPSPDEIRHYQELLGVAPPSEDAGDAGTSDR